MLNELKCAERFSSDYLQGVFSDANLWWMATGAAAKALRIEEKIGEIKVGAIADITIFRRHSSASAYRSIIDANPEDVLLVLKSGKPLYGETTLIDSLANDCEKIANPVCGTYKSICLRDLAGKTTFAKLESRRKDQYFNLYLCANEAEVEPTCMPFRPGEYDGEISAQDFDGDGQLNENDNCPDFFNPIRPMDNNTQADYDEDGVGDNCDTTPLG